MGGNYLTERSNFVFVFKSKDINDWTKLSFKLLNGKQQIIKICGSVQKFSQLWRL